MTCPRIRGQVASGRPWSRPGQVHGASLRGRLAGQGVRKCADHNRLLPAHESIGPLARVPVGVISHSVAVMRRTPSPWSWRLENAIFSVKGADARPLGCRCVWRVRRSQRLRRGGVQPGRTMRPRRRVGDCAIVRTNAASLRPVAHFRTGAPGLFGKTLCRPACIHRACPVVA